MAGSSYHFTNLGPGNYRLSVDVTTLPRRIRETFDIDGGSDYVAMPGWAQGKSAWMSTRWANRRGEVSLKTPGLQSWLGRQLGLITFTGHRSGRSFTTPVTDFRDADAVTDDGAKLPLVTEFLRNRPRDAKAYGATLGTDGEIDPDTARALAPQLVAIRVRLD